MAHYPQDKREQTKSTDNKKNLSLPSIGVYSNLNQSSPTKHKKQWKKTPVKYDNLAETYDQDTSKYGCASWGYILPFNPFLPYKDPLGTLNQLGDLGDL